MKTHMYDSKSNPIYLNRTRQHFQNVVRQRNLSRSGRDHRSKGRSQNRPARKSNKTNTKLLSKTTENSQRPVSISRPTYKGSSISYSTHQHLTSGLFNKRINQSIPVRDNYTYESEFPDIKPPITTVSSTKHGECLVVAGTESLFPVQVLTTAHSNPTLEGTVLASIPINPQLLSGTRLNKLSENYTYWYPKELVIEYVPLGSALDRGSIISVPTLDPEDTFYSGDPDSVIRRALSYERSVSFNIYDKPQFLLPPTESDDLFYITPGQNARQEISHVWHAIAQTTYNPFASETSRLLGWFKLHYVIELYDPRLLDTVLMPDITQAGVVVARLTLHGAVTTAGALVLFNNDYVTDSLANGGIPSRMIWQLKTQSYINTTDTAVIAFGDHTVNLETPHQTFYLRVQDTDPSYCLLFSNLSDCFNNTNPASWTVNQVAVSVTVSWVSTALQVDQ